MLGLLSMTVLAAAFGWDWRLRLGLVLASAAAFVLFLAGGQPPSHKAAQANFQRALRHVQLGGIDKAAPYFAEAAECDADNHYFWYVRATAHLRSGAESEYQADCEHILRNFTPTQSPFIAERTAKLLLLRPENPRHVEAGIRLAKQAVQSDHDRRLAHWIELAGAISEYRAGDSGVAAAHLADLEKQTRFGQPFTAMSGLFLAMAQHQTGQSSAAAATFQRATRRIDDPQRSEAGWLDWMMCEAVRSEAEQLLK